MGQRLKSGIRFTLGAIGGFLAAFHVVSVLASGVLSLIAVLVGAHGFSSVLWAFGLGVVGGCLAGAFSGRRCVQSESALKRVWLFAVTLIGVGYLIFIPYFGADPIRVIHAIIQSEPASSIIYLLVSLGLFLVPLGAAYYHVYRGGYDRLQTWLSS